MENIWIANSEKGAIGKYVIFWMLGIPLPVLLAIYLLKGCS